MLDAFLVPDKTVVTTKGDSESLDISAVGSRIFLVTLAISEAVEQESMELGLFTSADGSAWDTKPVATLPQKFYAGEYPLLVDLSAAEAAKFVRVHWDVNRWGRGSLIPHFGFGVRIREVSPQALSEAKAEGHSYR